VHDIDHGIVLGVVVVVVFVVVDVGVICMAFPGVLCWVLYLTLCAVD